MSKQFGGRGILQEGSELKHGPVRKYLVLHPTVPRHKTLGVQWPMKDVSVVRGRPSTMHLIAAMCP